MAFVKFLKYDSGLIQQQGSSDSLEVLNMNVLGDLTVSGSEIIVGSTTFQGQVNIGDDAQDVVTITSSGTTLTGDGDLTLGGDLTAEGITDNSLTASRLVATDGGSGLTSVGNLTSWVAGTANQVNVGDDADGTITLSTPQDIHSGASPTFANLTVTDDATIGDDLVVSGTITAGGSGSTIEFSATSGTIGVSGDTNLIQISSAGDLGNHSSDFYLDSDVIVEFGNTVYIDNWLYGTNISGTFYGDGSNLTGLVTAHSALTGLHFASAGHPDFMSLGTAQSVSGTKTWSGANILTAASGTNDIGSAAAPFANLYADDVYVKGTSLHIGNTVVLSEYNYTDLTINTDIRWSAATPQLTMTASTTNMIFKLGSSSTMRVRDSADGDIFAVGAGMVDGKLSSIPYRFIFVCFYLR